MKKRSVGYSLRSIFKMVFRVLLQFSRNFLKVTRTWWLGADLKVSAELADIHRIIVVATQCFRALIFQHRKDRMNSENNRLSTNAKKNLY